MQKLFAAFTISDIEEDRQRSEQKNRENKCNIFGIIKADNNNNNNVEVSNKNVNDSEINKTTSKIKVINKMPKEIKKKHSTSCEKDKNVEIKVKRQVDISDAEDNSEEKPKTKKVRRLKRGLRLCSNITCYIEQIIYN